MSAVIIHHFLSFYEETSERKRDAISTRTRTSRPSGVYLTSESEVPRQLCRIHTTSAEARPATCNDPSQTNLDRMNEQLGNRQHSNILWHLPHFLVIVRSGGGFRGRTSPLIQLGHLIRSFEVPYSSKDPRYPQQTEEERESGREDWEDTRIVQHE